MEAIALLSGGLDSTVNFKRALEEGEVALALTLDYGQRSAQREIEAAKAITSRYGVAHRVTPLPWLAEITTTALVNRDRNLPTPADGDLDSAADETAAAVWVPNRNGVFINEKRVAEQVLKNGDIVTIGTTDFRYEERPKR